MCATSRRLMRFWRTSKAFYPSIRASIPDLLTQWVSNGFHEHDIQFIRPPTTCNRNRRLVGFIRDAIMLTRRKEGANVNNNNTKKIIMIISGPHFIYRWFVLSLGPKCMYTEFMWLAAKDYMDSKCMRLLKSAQLIIIQLNVFGKFQKVFRGIKFLRNNFCCCCSNYS